MNDVCPLESKEQKKEKKNKLQRMTEILGFPKIINESSADL